MALLSLHDVTLSFGGAPLIDGVELHVEKGERVGLLGRNGCGKSTLLKLLGGVLEPDDGRVVRAPGVTVAGLQQDVPESLQGTIENVLRRAVEEAGTEGDWDVDKRIESVAKELGLDLAEEVRDLSAGSKRRVLLGCALAQEPDVLLLDEPTNHLDIEAIRGLEEYLQHRAGTVLFVTHDRAFLRKLSTRILDLDRGRLRSYSCDYDTYLERREADLEAEEHENAEFDKKLAKEEAWLRRGIKARRTRNQGRVRALLAMREERAARRDAVGRVRAELQQADRTGQVVARAKRVTHGYGGETYIDDFSTEIQRGDRIGILGPNGCGKTTLLKLLLGELIPDEGSIHHGTKLEIARFDQLHSLLDENKTLQENVCDYGDMVTVGDRSRHIIGYLQDFLFTPEQIRGGITRLSGGERNRLQLAKILARPCNVLVLDEPTNDLDLETLELLEEILLDYQGTLLLVSHDRAFLENVVTSLFVFEGKGEIGQYVGGYRDWRDAQAPVEAAPKPRTKPKQKPRETSNVRKLTFTEQHELKGLPDKIESLETSKAELEATLSEPDFFKRPGDEITAATAELESLTAELEEVYERWTELESIAAGEVEA